jgi:hypothetical protein
MNTASKIIGIIALIFMIIGLIPLLGWINYLVIFLAILGLIFGIFSKNTGGLTLNGIVLIVSLIRLIAGGGIV